MGLHAKKLVCTGLNYCMLCSIHFISLHIHSSIFLFICDDSSLQSNFFFCWIHQIEFLLHLLLDSIYYLLSSWRIVVREGGVAVAWHSSYFLVQCFIVQYGCMHICFFFWNRIGISSQVFVVFTAFLSVLWDKKLV